jgi:thiamine monophosphate synthase
MRLEDALLGVILKARHTTPPQAGRACGAAIAGGADLIQVAAAGAMCPPRETLEAVVGACRRDDAMVVFDGNPELACELGADGVHVRDESTPLGYARSVVGIDHVVGTSASSVIDATLALELAPDYLLYYGGASRQLLSGLRDLSQAVLFAAGIADIEAAGRAVDEGVYRICVDHDLAGPEDIGERMARFSMTLGRCL